MRCKKEASEVEKKNGRRAANDRARYVVYSARFHATSRTISGSLTPLLCCLDEVSFPADTSELEKERERTQGEEKLDAKLWKLSESTAFYEMYFSRLLIVSKFLSIIFLDIFS